MVLVIVLFVKIAPCTASVMVGLNLDKHELYAVLSGVAFVAVRQDDVCCHLNLIFLKGAWWLVMTANKAGCLPQCRQAGEK